MKSPLCEPNSILVRLREETRAEHSAAARAIDLLNATLDIVYYRKVLDIFYGYYRPLENTICEFGDWSEPSLSPHDRTKSHLLAEDISALGGASAELPLCADVPHIAHTADGLGCLYVLEGATLGGQIICRHARDVLRLTPATGCRFFHGYGERTGDMWRAFGTTLTGYARDGATQDRVVAAARDTFVTLRQWCERGGIV
ncbi:biliverdin-producing heme oxygenase [Gemmata sp. JC717]|uniref:biliverdin-producing heme oxygenase n=1 Tax=Gemmata algarum TaxID=2975278 RepID=UPI0021BB6964|nr:biliverdin-producing heme oxygenase [Gemmata algarum]MDY3552961.1 biliverdin-producing heme oxygenase [Gemmata algarum]